MSAGLQSSDFDLEFVRIGCRGLAAAVRDEALGWVRALREVMGELDAQTMQVMVPSAFNAPMHSSVGWAWCWLQNLWLLHVWRAVSCLLLRHYHNASRSLACDTALGTWEPMKQAFAQQPTDFSAVPVLLQSAACGRTSGC